VLTEQLFVVNMNINAARPANLLFSILRLSDQKNLDTPHSVRTYLQCSYIILYHSFKQHDHLHLVQGT